MPVNASINETKGLSMARKAGKKASTDAPQAVRRRQGKAGGFIQPATDSTEFLTDLIELIQPGLNYRKELLDFVNSVDLRLDGDLLLTQEQQDMEADTEAGLPPMPIPRKLCLITAQFTEAVSACMGVLGEQNRLYQAVDAPDRQASASQMAAAMNTGAVTFGHYSAIQYALYSGLRYNMFIMSTRWDKVTGSVLERDEDNPVGASVKQKTAVVAEGNNLLAINPANFICDTRCKLTDLPKQGQYFGVVERTSMFAEQRLNMAATAKGQAKQTTPHEAEKASAFNLGYEETFLDGVAVEPGDAKSERDKALDEYWAPNQDGKQHTKQCNKLTLFVFWPNETNTELVLWELVFINGGAKRFTKMANPHGMLPVAVSTPSHGKSYGLKLLPFQDAATHKVNLDVDAGIRSLYGVLFYNKKLFPELGGVSPLAARIPFAPEANTSPNLNGQDLKFINDAPDTSQTMQQLAMINEQMQQVLPTATAARVAGLDRATRFQAAAVVAASSQTLLNILRIVHTQGLSPLLEMQMYNVLMYQQDMEVAVAEDTTVGRKEGAEAGGEFVQITRSDLLSFKGDLAIGTGLKGLDRLATVELLRDVLGMVIQSSQGNEEVDLLALADYYTSVAGETADLTKFRRAPPVQQEGQPQADGQPAEGQPTQGQQAPA